MNEEETKSIIISDLLKIEDYRSSKEFGTSKDSDRYNNMDVEILKQVHYAYIKFLLCYRTMGKAYPSILESLKYSNDKIAECIENHRDEEKKQLQRRTIVRTYLDEDDDEDDEYCDACHQSPCMCSDREATSTVHDF